MTAAGRQRIGERQLGMDMGRREHKDRQKEQGERSLERGQGGREVRQREHRVN